MTRSLKKGYYANEKLLKKIARQDESGEKKIIKTRQRSSSVLPQMVGHTFAIHNGKSFFTLYVTEEMLGHKLGEFASTRTFKGHPF